MAQRRGFFRTAPGLAFLAILATLALGIIIGSIVSDGVGANPAEVQVAKLTRKGGGAPLVLDQEVPLHEGFSRVVETVGPAVVNISTQSLVEISRGRLPDALREFFGRDPFNPPDERREPQERKFSGLGSGVVVDSAGYILTNYHVIQSADKITVTLPSNSSFPAEVIGFDRQSDLAVLKIDADEPLPFAQIGDSEKVKVGDWVLAIGSPFGLQKTVTAGIVSATGRVGLTQIFGDYIQTDAAINPGNSGGPLVNARGEVVGINSFITTRSGGSNGVGFAIPSTVFVNSYNQLVTKGKIERGFMGIAMNLGSLTPEMAEFFGVAGDASDGVKDGDGVLVTQVFEDGPADQAGLEPEDVIVKVAEREVQTSWDLRAVIANTPPHQEVPIKVVRKGKVLELSVTLAERTVEQELEEQNQGISLDEKVERDRKKEIGLEVRSATERDLERLGIEDEEGILILEVTPTSLADDAGLRPGEIVTHVNGEPVATGPEFRDKILDLDSHSGSHAYQSGRRRWIEAGGDRDPCQWRARGHGPGIQGQDSRPGLRLRRDPAPRLLG